jgi:hypothetical protein
MLVVCLMVAACGGGGEEVVGGQSVFEMEVGMCFDDVDSDEVTDVPVIECSEPHDNEAFSLLEYTGSTEFPGQAAINEGAQELCIAEFEEYVGLAYLDSALEVFPITPTAASWEEGDREIICALYNLDLSKLTTSMRGAAR